MKSVALTAYPRALKKRTGVKKVRSSGRIPAVIYGRHNQPQNLEIGAKDLETVVHGSVSETLLVDLSIDGAKRLALLKNVQHHPLTGAALHVDLHEVAEDEKVTAMVPVETEGEATGVKVGGGVLEHVLFKLKVRATPKNLPEVITIDVSNLEVGKSIHIGDIQAPEGVEILGNKEISVVSVAAPLTEAQQTAAAETTTAAPTQPEMLKEKKEEGAGAGGDKKAAEKKK